MALTWCFLQVPFWTNPIFTLVALETRLNLWLLLDNSGALENDF
ncbi:hypothetical protein PI124_g18193 [Phytophthora idaei]|nr:hypothetical protein PI125_g18982 [Phytophthora idaei]KAG3137320.1 hypothetical protein PI126_g17445 [Phytophthora idaei]KAG3236803.1 hypothetical protein PI124_g18193 [Phytophthora idaei]